MFKKSLMALALMAAAVTTANAAPVNLIQNGSFELPDISSPKLIDNITNNPSYQADGWEVLSNPNLPGWTAGQNGVELRRVEGAPQDGKNFVELDGNNNGWISQTINTVADQMYTLSFWYSDRINTSNRPNTNGINWAFGNNNNGGPLLTNSASSSSHAWTHFTQNIMGTGNPMTLKFSAAGTSDSYGSSLDNVSVTATPIPAAIWLFGSALAGLVGVSRRKASGLAA